MDEKILLSPPTLDDLRAQRAQILALAKAHGAYNVRIFGSVARGEASSNSDVDILVSFYEGASIYNISGLWQDLQELLGRSVDLLTDDEQPRHKKFMRQVLKRAVPL